jgi:hypothetical protein
METTTETEVAPSLTQQEIVRAAFNDPSLSENEVKLGDRTFKIIDLDYDSYNLFLVKLQPILGLFASSVVPQLAGSAGNITADQIIKYCADDLPEMARLSLSQTEPDITVDEIKKLAKSPFKLAAVVLKQIDQNKMIEEISTFFGAILPLIGAGLKKK